MSLLHVFTTTPKTKITNAYRKMKYEYLKRRNTKKHVMLIHA